MVAKDNRRVFAANCVKRVASPMAHIIKASWSSLRNMMVKNIDLGDCVYTFIGRI